MYVGGLLKFVWVIIIITSNEIFYSVRYLLLYADFNFKETFGNIWTLTYYVYTYDTRVPSSMISQKIIKIV